MSRDEVRAYSTDGEVKPPSVLVVDNDPLIVALITGLLISENYSVTKSYKRNTSTVSRSVFQNPSIRTTFSAPCERRCVERR